MSYFPTGLGAAALTASPTAVRALQAQVNRFLPSASALPVTGVLDLATGQAAFQLVLQSLLRSTTQDPSNASIKAQYLDASKHLATGPAWVQEHVLEATYAIRELGDAQGKPGAGTGLPLEYVLGGAALLLLLMGSR